ncbi:MAG: helix-turn-helix transcriptional regulator [Rhodothermales bacterium]
MAANRTRSLSPPARLALGILGKLIRTGRIERKMTTAELAERAGISRDMLYRVEKGDPRCEIGVVFELATIVGVTLFEPEVSALRRLEHRVADRLTLLPKSVRNPEEEVYDDF